MEKDPRICDLGRTVIALRSDLIFTPRIEGGEPYYLIEDPVHSTFFRVGVSEYAFLTLLDGKTTLSEAVRLTARVLPAQSLSEQKAASISKWLIDNKLAQVPGATMPAVGMSATGGAPRSPGESSTRWNPLALRIPLVRPDRFFSAVHPWIDWLHSPSMIAVTGVLILCAAYQLAVQWERFVASSRVLFSPQGTFFLGACWLLLKLAHETAHAAVCKRYGGNVREAGVMLVLLVPLAYVDVTSAWRFRSKWQRIHTAAAGMLVELLIASLAALFWSATGPGLANQLSFHLVVTAGFTTLIFNANPLVRLDGYYILSDWMEIPNLYGRGQQTLRYWARRYLLALPASPPSWPAGRALFIRAYAIGALIWRLVVSVSLTLAAATMLRGAGLILALLAAIVWFLLPLGQLAKYVLFGHAGERPNRLRFACLTGVASLAVALVLALPWPGGCRAPAIVEYAPLERVRAASPGFVESVCVRSGERVGQRQVLVQLSNPDLQLELDELELAISKSRLESRGHQQNQQMAAYQAELKDEEGLEKRRQEKRAQVDELAILAPIAGTVMGRDLARLEGNFVQAGTQVASVCNLARKELRISIDQNDLDLFSQRVGQTLHVRMRGCATFGGRLSRISPQASLEPTHPALCASAGGPLAVRPKDVSPADPPHIQQSMELIAPRFDGTVQLSPAQSGQLRAGQRGVVSFTSGQQTVGKHLYRAIASWMAQKLGRRVGR